MLPSQPAEMTARPVFISHASKDQELVEGLVDLLRAGVGLRDEEHFCSSLPGTAIPAGQDFVDRIRAELKGTQLAIEVITPSYLDSKFCLCELGALWVTMADNLPMIVPPVKHRDLVGILGNIQAPQFADALDDMADRVATVIGRKVNLPAWGKARADFQQRLPGLLAGVTQGDNINREQHEHALHQLDETAARLAHVTEEYRRAADLGQKLDYVIEVLPELLHQLNLILSAATDERETSAMELEYVVAFHAAHLYGRRGYRSVVWRYRDGQFHRGRHVGTWQRTVPQLTDRRWRLLEQRPLRSFEDVWVDDPDNPAHKEANPLGSGDPAFPSFVLASLLADRRNLGILQVDAPMQCPLLEEDLRPLGLLATVLAAGWAFADPMLGVDRASIEVGG